MTTMLEDSSVHSDSIELRSRSSKNHTTTSSSNHPWHCESGGNKLSLVEHVVRNSENLMQIALQYSVPVSEIKRVNNIVADQEIHGLPVVRVPVTRAFLLRRQMDEAAAQNNHEGQIIDILGEGQGLSRSSRDGERERTDRSHPDQWQIKQQDAMAEAYSSNESLAADKAREAIECILDETDRNMAAIRQNLPSSPALEGGAFHFVDAGTPDHSSHVWLIVAIVLFIFVLLPLALTFLEENSVTEEHHQRQ